MAHYTGKNYGPEPETAKIGYTHVIKKPLNCYTLSLCLLLSTVLTVHGQRLNGFDLSNVTIEASKIHRGGPPKDGIPALTNPSFVSAKKASYLFDSDRVIGVEINGIARAYPIKILNYHEIVNDKLNDANITVSFCPLCGSGIVFDAMIDGEPKQFGVSGLLYNSDVLMYDRESESLWSQLMNQAVSGKYAGTRLRIIESANTTWGAWRKAHITTQVLSDKTGFVRDYSRTPYTDYDKTKTVYFPVDHWDNTFFSKEMVLGIEVKGKFKAYAFSELKKGPGELADNFNGKNLLIQYDKKSRTAGLQSRDSETRASTAYWFAWFTFHPDTDIYRFKAR